MNIGTHLIPRMQSYSADFQRYCCLYLFFTVDIQEIYPHLASHLPELMQMFFNIYRRMSFEQSFSREIR